ncbi:MAG: 3-methyl-2-oxobutanoate hydroxymethyltransferase [Miltoncostaeaceae bacterium]
MGGRVTPLSAADLRSAKGRRRLAVLTAYDYPMALALDGVGLDIILVGDSLGEVELGYESTRSVTLEMMEHHVRAVANGATRTHITGDLPADTYGTPQQAVESSRALIAAGAQSVKLEGALIPQVEAIIAAGIPVMGHVGLLPQTAEGGYRKQGRTQAESDQLLADAVALDRAGCFAIVIEAVDPAVSTRISPVVGAPTIGIAAGTDCDGQVLVSTDLMGLLPNPPPFVTPKVNLRELIIAAGEEWSREVRGT